MELRVRIQLLVRCQASSQVMQCLFFRAYA
jgi:hypothetical protein